MFFTYKTYTVINSSFIAIDIIHSKPNHEELTKKYKILSITHTFLNILNPFKWTFKQYYKGLDN